MCRTNRPSEAIVRLCALAFTEELHARGSRPRDASPQGALQHFNASFANDLLVLHSPMVHHLTWHAGREQRT